MTAPSRSAARRALDIRVEEFGDSALRVSVDGGDRERRWQDVHALTDVLGRSCVLGLRELIPTYESVFVEFDCTVTDHAGVEAAIRRAWSDVATGHEARESRVLLVPAVYGGEHGPDLEFVAEHLGMTTEEVIDRHTSRDLTVRCLAAAGSAMMDGPPFGAQVPRLAAPRARIPAGAVTLAGAQAMINVCAVPSGWQIIGRSPLRFLRLDRQPVTAYRPGDRIRFQPITADQWDEFSGEDPVQADE